MKSVRNRGAKCLPLKQVHFVLLMYFVKLDGQTNECLILLADTSHPGRCLYRINRKVITSYRYFWCARVQMS